MRIVSAWIARLFALPLAAGLLVAPAAAGPLRDLMRDRIAERVQARIADAPPPDPATILPGSTVATRAYGPAGAERLDVYTPPGARAAPVLVMVHGGAWRVGDKARAEVVVNKLKHWLPKGFVFVSVNYRMLPEVMADTQADDVAAALRWVQAHAAEFGGDPRRIVLMGHSAGAHLAALLSTEPARVGRPWAGTVVLDTAVLDVPAKMAGRHAGFYDEAFGSDPAYWRKTSPLDHWSPTAVPMLLVCSTERADRPCDEARAFAARTAKVGRTTPVLSEPLSHGAINATLGAPGAYTAAVDAFIADHLR